MLSESRESSDFVSSVCRETGIELSRRVRGIKIGYGFELAAGAVNHDHRGADPCGGDLIGYFAPHEGSSTIAYGVYHVENLAAYEAYRATLRGIDLPRLDARFELTRA